MTFLHDIDLLNLALDHAVNDGVLSDSEADHLEQQFIAGQEARG